MVSHPKGYDKKVMDSAGENPRRCQGDTPDQPGEANKLYRLPHQFGNILKRRRWTIIENSPGLSLPLFSQFD
jgi:hypothetical protein